MPYSDDFIFEDENDIQPAPVAAPARALYEAWPSDLTRDLALEPDREADVLARHNITNEKFSYLLTIPAFRLELAQWHKDVNGGLKLEMKAKAIAESLLPEVYDMIIDRNAEPKTRLEAYKMTCQLGGLLDKKESTSGNRGQQVNIQINL